MSPYQAWTSTFLWARDVWDAYLNFKKRHKYVWLAASALCTAECTFLMLSLIPI